MKKLREWLLWVAGDASARRLAVTVLLAFAGIGTVTVLADPDGDGPAPARPVLTVPRILEVKVDGADADRVRDDVIRVPAAAVDAAERGDVVEQDLREADDPAPAGVLPAGTPLAAQEWPGCRTRFVGNFSARTARAQVIVLHQTVSFDRPGWADQDVLTAMANRRSAGVSWHFLVGAVDGLCTYTVPLPLKAWTQGSANSISVGIEVQRFGSEASYVEAKGRARLVSIMRGVGRELGIPMQKAIVRWNAGCVPVVVRRGVLEHSDLGPCGGGHVDVTSGKRPEPAAWRTESLVAQAAADPCGTRCRRARDLRRRHDAVHRAIVARCRGAVAHVGPSCVELRRRNRVLHRVAKREGVKL